MMLTCERLGAPTIARGAPKSCRTSNDSGLTERLGDFGSEIVLLLLDALAHLEPHHPTDGQGRADGLASLGDEILHLLLVVLDGDLIDEAHVLEELAELALDDRRPALFRRRLRGRANPAYADP